MSRVLAGHDRVRPDTRARVLTAVAELGYVPSGAAQDLADLGVRRLPWTLGEAVTAFEQSEFARGVLGDELHASYAQLRRAEWEEYNTVVGDWEQARYLRLW